MGRTSCPLETAEGVSLPLTDSEPVAAATHAFCFKNSSLKYIVKWLLKIKAVFELTLAVPTRVYVREKSGISWRFDATNGVK
ncbi:hypothetical protein ACEQPO_30735 [Bacillus sp. SL00103]